MSPEDVAHAATIQTAHVFHQSKQSAGRLGLESTIPVDGGTASYAPGSLLPEVVELLAPWRRMDP